MDVGVEVWAASPISQRIFRDKPLQLWVVVSGAAEVNPFTRPPQRQLHGSVASFQFPLSYEKSNSRGVAPLFSSLGPP